MSKMIRRSIENIEIVIESQMRKLKQKSKEHFMLKSSIKCISTTAKNCYVLSSGFEEMYFGVKSRKRFVIRIFLCILTWLAALHHLIMTVSSDLWSLIDGPFIPKYFRQCILVRVLLLFLVATLKTDILLGEINDNLSPVRIFYHLSMDIKSKHKLTDHDYKRLAILTRIILIFLMDYGVPILSILLIAIETSITISSKKLFWLFNEILMYPFYFDSIITLTTTACIAYVYFVYYKMRFDQITKEIKSIVKDGETTKSINKRRKKKLIYWIHEHNLASIEIHKMNLTMRRVVAMIFVVFSSVKIISIYLIMNLKHTLLKIFVINLFGIFFIFGFGLTFLFSYQIKSAHKSLKLFYSIVCNYRMRLSFRLKVNLI